MDIGKIVEVRYARKKEVTTKSEEVTTNAQ